MKKFFGLMLILALCGLANAAVSFELSGATINAAPGEVITLNVVSNAPLFTLDAVASITGDAIITGVMAADAGNFGWDYTQFPDTPIFTPTSVEFGGTQMNNNNATIIGYITVQANSGLITVNLNGGYGLTGATMTMDPEGNEVMISDSLSILVPEPATMVILALGGLLLRRK